MATMTRAESKHMYSWWWDSHISPKNSRWLQENLTDMDAKVKLMIKLIEVDEDSFARRAEMYYKKRPELMKLVEEFYRAFRALAERYDHATGVIKQAHTTMAEAFPNQVPFLVSDDGSFSSPGDSSPFTPEMSVSVRAFCDPGNFHSEERNGPFASGEELSFSKVKKGLNFLDADEKEVQIQKNEISPQNAPVFSESERLGKSETDIQELKEALARLEAEKQAGMLEYEERLRRLSNLESEVSRAQEDSRGLHERSSKAEAEVLSLKESLSKLEGERESCLHRYQQCLDRISNLESDVSRLREDAEKHDKQASLAEKESRVLRKELVQLKADKEAGLAKYMEALEKIANLDNRLLLAEGKASVTFERAYNAEKEVATLKEALDRATKEKEAAAVQHQQCLEKIATLESEIALSLEEAARLKGEIDQGAAKLKGKEEQYHLLERSNNSMQRELDSLSNKLGVQNEELSEKQKELGRLWTCVQEERLRFVEVETAFRALQGLHSQTQEELRSVAAELQKRVQLLNDMDIHNQRLQDEVQKIRDENKTLSEHNLSSAVLQKNTQAEIFNLKEGKNKLEAELELQSDERNAFQHEVYCLKEELNVLNKKHQAMLDQVEILGFLPECFGSSVKSLQDENSKLKESCQRSEAEISAVLEKLVVMEELIVKKAILEHSLSDLSAQLEAARGRIKALEESYKLLMNEKSMAVAERATLSVQLDILTENLDKLSERNTLLENSLHDTNGELEALKKTSKNLEDSYRLLNDDKSILLSERQALELKLETAHQRLAELGKRHEELEHKYSYIEDERQIALKLVENLHISLTDEKKMQETSARLRNLQMTEMEKKFGLLQEKGQCTRGQLEEELDQAVCSQFEIYILLNVLRDLKETNSSFLNKCDKLLETSKLSEELILELEYENIEQHQEVNFLSEQIKRLRMGMFELLKVLDVDMELVCEDNVDKDQMILHRLLNKVDDTRSSLCKAWDENQKLLIEKSVLETLLGQLKQEVSDLKAVINTLHQEFRTGNDQLTSLQKGMHKLLQSHEQLILAVEEGNNKDELFVAEVVNLKAKLLEMQSVCQDLEKENCGILEEKRSLVKTVTHLDDEKIKLEHDNSCLFVDAVTLDTLSLIFKNNILERTEVIKQLAHSTCKLCDDNRVLEDKVKIMESMVEKYQVQNMNMKDSLEKFDNELKEVSTANSQLRLEIAQMKDQLSQKELEFSEAQAVKDDQGKQILELSEQYDQLLKESESLRESMQNANAEVWRVLKNQKETDTRVEILQSELKKIKIEAELWETVAGTFFSEVQTSSVREALFREKFSELGREYECLEDENHSKDLEAVQLKERVGSLEGENSQIKAQLAGHIQTLETLRDSVASLESHVTRTEFENDNDKDASSASSHEQSTYEVIAAPASDGISDLLDISTRIKAIESKVIETKRLAEERSCKLLKSQSSRSRRGSSGRSSRHIPSESMEEQPATRHHRHNTKQQKPASYPYEAGELLMKDIMLDQASEASSRWKNRRGGYNNSQSDDQILELWQTMDQAGSIDLTVGSHYQHLEAMKEINGSGKLEVDRVEISKTAPIEADTKRKILDRLASDVQKLTNLQITVQDLKQKVVITENSNPSKGKGSEYARIKEQLDEADRANAKLLDVNGKLMKKVETSSSIDDCFEAGQSGRTRRVSEQARRCSEKIGRLQLEVQKIQFVLVKLDGGNKTTGTRVAERNNRVLLKDYLYASSRTPRRRKKAHFCGCMHTSPTSGD